MGKERWLTPWRLSCAALILLSALAFAGSLPGVAIWDDIPLINGTGIGGGHSLLHVFTRPFLDNYFRPLVSLSFFIERPLWGSGPFGYHQTNLLIHALNTGLMITLLQTAFGDRRIAFLGAAIFAFHPVHVSAVAWIGGRTDPLLCLFMTLYALGLIRSAQALGADYRRPLLWSAFWYGLALLCKEQVLAALPLAPLAYRFFGAKEWDDDRKRRARETTFAYAFVAGIFVICWFLTAPPKQSLLANGLANHVLRSGGTLLSYAGLLLAPNATWMHAFTLGPVERFGWAGAAAGFAVFGALMVFVRAAWKRGSQTAWWGLWTILTLLPVCNFLPIATLLVAPYRAEIAQIGLSALVGSAAVTAWDRLKSPAPRAALLFAGAGAAAWCLYLCLWGSSLWINGETIFRQICRVDPDCIFARESVVQSLLNRRRLREAGGEVEALLERLFPHGQWRDAALVLRTMRQDSAVMEKLRQNQGGSIDPNAWLSDVYSQLGSLRVRQGDKQKGEVYLRTAVTLDANCFDGLLELGFLTLGRGDIGQARFWAERAVARGPDVSDAYTLRGRCYLTLGMLEKARRDFKTCVTLQPWAGQAYIELADIQKRMGDRRGAAETLQAALRQSPQRSDIRQRLKQVYL